jgi:pyruvate formate lyase activating enzyme
LKNKINLSPESAMAFNKADPPSSFKQQQYDEPPSSGWIFDIKRFAVHDGPGIRTTIFLKGCSLQCQWCHNPESIHPFPELFITPERCIGCNTCIDICPNGAHYLTSTGEKSFSRNRCTTCGQCVEHCYADALLIAGRYVTVEDVLAVIREDATFYALSGGGVTLSGGEPLVQDKFAVALLQQAKTEGFHTALDTSGHVDWDVFERALPFLDLVLYDLKHIDPVIHQQYVGASNHRILINLRKLSRRRVPIEIRMPIIPTINDAHDVIESTALFLTSLKSLQSVRLLAYHRFAASKYRSVGRVDCMPNVPAPTREQLQNIATHLRNHDLKVIIPELESS